MNALYCLFKETCRKHPDRPAVREQGGAVIRYGRLEELASSAADWLTESGVTAGQHVALFAQNGIEFIIGYWAIQKVSAVAVLVPAFSKSWDLKRIQEHCDIDHWLTDFLRRTVLEETFTIQTVAPRWPSASLYLMQGSAPASRAISHSMAVILPTSGTTGRLKGVMLDAESLAWNAQAYAKDLQLDEADKVLLMLPMTGAFAHTTQMLAHLFTGGELIFGPDLFMPQDFTHILQRIAPTITGLVPSLYRKILALHPKAYRVPLQKLVIAGEPIDQSLVQQSRQRFPGIEIIKAYGLSEAGPRVTQISSAHGTPFDDTVGGPLPGVRIKIVNDQFQSLGPGETGEICVASPGLMKGYYKDPEHTRAVMSQGWLRTGDIGQLNQQGFLIVLGRSKNLIIKSGYNVSPEEIEAFLNTIPGIGEALVFGRQNHVYGEAIVAHVVPIKKASLEVSDILSQCRARLAPVKVPDEIHLVEALPDSGNGKLVRKQVRGRRPKLKGRAARPGRWGGEEA
jgi:long-chain acyl-CoA synthetase